LAYFELIQDIETTQNAAIIPFKIEFKKTGLMDAKTRAAIFTL
jgi:hypothetical protein